MSKMRNIPIMTPYFSGEEIKDISEVIKSGWVAQGTKVAEFEKLVASHEKIDYGIATTSCTTALHLALIAMGVGKGDDVIIPSFTFVATANAVLYTGATPIFVDIEEHTYSISIKDLIFKIKELYGLNTEKNILINKETGNILKAIIPVNLFGLCADIPKINEVAKEYNLLVIEDSACALGAKIGDIHQGGFGNPSCISFHPRKSITTGEGGMILAKDEEFADKVRMLRSHGASVSEVNRHNKGGFLLPEFDTLGYNYRMTDIQAALGLSQIKNFNWIIEERRKKAKKYNELLQEIKWINTPIVPEGYYHTYQSYVCMLNIKELGCETIEKTNEFRNKLMLQLEENGIATRQGTHAVHTLGYYKNKYSFSNEYCINSYKADRLSITLPLYIQMSDDDQEYVVNNLQNIKESIQRQE